MGLSGTMGTLSFTITRYWNVEELIVCLKCEITIGAVGIENLYKLQIRVYIFINVYKMLKNNHVYATHS